MKQSVIYGTILINLVLNRKSLSLCINLNYDILIKIVYDYCN